MLIIALASALFYPVLAGGSLFGSDVVGFIAPIGIASIFGSFMFGLGMQFGGCCASGALSWVGAGSTRIILTLLGFIIGAVWGPYDIAFWRSLPGVPINLTTEFGVFGGLAITLFICATVAFATLVFENVAMVKSYHTKKTTYQYRAGKALQHILAAYCLAMAPVLLMAAISVPSLAA